MARHTYWKEATVALNILFCFLLFSASAQSPALRSNITYSCRAEKLESVIEHLSKTTGYDFIYSRDLVDISRTISLTVQNKSIDEVLTLIEKQVNVSFKLKDRHIIVKNFPKPVAPAKTIVPVMIDQPSEDELITSISKSIPVKPVESHTTLLQRSLEKRIKEVQDMLGTTTPKNIPVQYISQINFNNRHRNWYASVGSYFGDEHSGVELQAGLPFLYAVFNPHWQGSGFYGSYGVGNTMNLRGNFSFNTIYLYSSRTTSEVSHPFSNPYMGDGPTVVKTHSVRQHQVKLAIRYSFTKNLSVRVGPVLNYRTTVKEITIGSNTSMPETTKAYGNNFVIHNRRIESQNSRLHESWIGWDASIQFRINFFESR